MHRTNLLMLFARYLPNERDEVTFKHQMIRFIKRNEDCFKRGLTSGHVTASAWLISKDSSKALLRMHHARLHQWFQLGGHCDGDYEYLRVALKEAQEESGITSIIPVSQDIFDIDVHLIPSNARERLHYHYDIRFLLKVASDEQVKPNNESNELRWISKNRDELPTTSASVVRMFDKWVSRGQPLMSDSLPCDEEEEL